MYNYGNRGRGIDRTFPDNSPGSGSSSASFTTTTVTTQQQQQQQQQKYSVAGSSQFVPSLNAITSSQDLQWMLQPSLLGSAGPSRPLRPSYPLPPRVSAMNPPHPGQPHLSRPGVIRAALGVGSSTRSRNDELLSAEELERRRIRRERNKMAAAKCRNRRRELTETLQNETEHLEDKKSRLQKEIAELQKQKEKLELVLEAHRPICKVQDSDSDSDSDTDLPVLSTIKIEPVDPDLPGPSGESKSHTKPNKPKISIPPPAFASSVASVPLESESLHTPILLSTPSLTPFSTSLIFSYPSSSLDASSAASSQTLGLSSSQHGTIQSSRNPQPCSIVHRRSSSSGDQSDHSLNSPTILTL